MNFNEFQVQQSGEDSEFLRQLSTLDFTAMQKETYTKRHANTGQWLLESPKFQMWLQLKDNEHSVLWYEGDPGVGKTVITSVAINHVTENFSEHGSAVVYIYCDYANSMTFSIENLLGSMVRQLVVQTSYAGTVAELKTFMRKPAKNRKMTREDLSFWIETFSQNFDVIYTFVDALDELHEGGRNKLLAHLQRFSIGNMRVFLTSRSNVNVPLKIPHAIRSGIAATSEDITTYVNSEIQESCRLENFTVKDPGLKQHITNTICNQANGMFLLAKLQVESLGDQTTAREVRSALAVLPTDSFAIYDQTTERIRRQGSKNAELGFKVLSMMFGAVRPLGVDELRHALAVEPTTTSIDPDNLADLEIMLSVTAGLVTTSQEQIYSEKEKVLRHVPVFRLVHYTLQEYFELDQTRLFPNLKLDMARACLSYLSLDDFGSGNCATDELFDKRRSDFAFLDYASYHWAHHLQGVQAELMDESLAFLQDSNKISAWLESYGYTICRHKSPFNCPQHPIFLTAHFHLLELFRTLISSRSITTKNLSGETVFTKLWTWSHGRKVGSRPSALSWT